jgi:hypothetical protein
VSAESSILVNEIGIDVAIINYGLYIKKVKFVNPFVSCCINVWSRISFRVVLKGSLSTMYVKCHSNLQYSNSAPTVLWNI